MLTSLLNNPLSAITFLCAVVVAITVHEFAHAWAATRLGDPLPESQGRLTLSPLAHLDPVGSLAFLIAGFGWGKPVQYNPNALGRRTDELVIALAGPFSNLCTALLFNLLTTALVQAPSLQHASQVGSIFATVNVTLAAFNILPFPPLDGSSIVAYFYPGYRSGRAAMIGGFALIILIVLVPGALGLLINPLIAGATWLTTLGGNLH